MEHKWEKAIREKLERLEDAPLVWDKQRVWQQTTKTSTSRRGVWPYAATTFILLAAAVVSWQVNESVPLKVETFDTPTGFWKAEQPNQVEANEIPCASIDSRPRGRAVSTKHTSKHLVASTPTLNEAKTEAFVNTTSTVSTFIDSAAAPTILATKNTPVAPLILGAEPPEVYILTTREKRLRMKLFKAIEEPRGVMATTTEEVEGFHFSRTKKQ